MWRQARPHGRASPGREEGGSAQCHQPAVSVPVWHGAVPGWVLAEAEQSGWKFPSLCTLDLRHFAVASDFNRHPGSAAEAHPDDLAVCRACAEPPSPARPWGCCQVPSCPPPPGSSVTTQRRRRSPAGPLDSWGQGRLHEHQPKLKCLFLLPCWLCSCPCARRPPPHPPPISGASSASPEDQRCREAVRESRGAARVQSVSRPANPTSTLRPQVERPPSWGHPECQRVDAFPRRTGSRFRAAAPMNLSVRVSPDLSAFPCLPLGYKWVASGRWGTQLSEGFALGWEYLTPRLVPERPRAEQTGPDPARMAFASSQRAPPILTPPPWRHPALRLGRRDPQNLDSEGRWDGLVVRQERVGGWGWLPPRKVLGRTSILGGRGPGRG
nr:uncharacterized protein LOC112831838 isoform X4 [Callorhinus ursinus]